jgi:glycosyltransferase 2 family protein
MIRPLAPKPGLLRILSATCIGFTAITLFGRAGEVVRPWLIAARERVPVSSQLAAWLLERIYDLLAVLVIFGYALSQAPGDVLKFRPETRWVLQTGGYLAAGIALVCIAVLVMVNRFSETSRARLTAALGFLPAKFHGRVDSLIHAFTSGMSSTRSGRQVALLLLWTVVDWALVAAATVALFRSLPATAGFGAIEAMMFLGFAAFGGAVQIPGIGGGTQVAAVLVLTELLGMDLEPASGVAILFWALGFLLIVPIGLVLMVHDGIKLRSLRHLSEAEATAVPTTEP